MSAVLPEPDTEPARPDAPPAADAEFFIVMNQRSGASGKDEVREAMEAVLREAGRRHQFVPVQPGQVLQACQQAGRLASGQGGVLVAVGGDGTINCAAQAALQHGCPLGVIAQGTFNLFARELGLPLDAVEATRALLQGRPEQVQVGWVNQRVFLVNASVGLYPKLLADREEIKQKLGRRRWIAIVAALKSFFEWRLQLALDAELDGHVTHMRVASVFVGNNRLQLERVGAGDRLVGRVTEGKLGVLVLPPMSFWTKLRMLAAAAFGKLAQEREVNSFALRTLTVASRHARRLKVAYDGEVQWMQLPLRFTVSPRPLLVMLPPPEQRLPPQ